MKIAIVGTGYVGLVSGTCFAETGINVSCIDIDDNKINKLNNGIIPIYEPGLDQLILRNRTKERLTFTTSLRDSMQDAEAIFIAVGTPTGEDGSADLKYVLAVACEIGKLLDHYMVIINKSTVPVGTGAKVKSVIENELQKRNLNIEFDIASNPEFLKEGNAIEDFLKPDRIIVGIDNERTRKVIDKLYKPFLLNGHPLLYMDILSAEMTKYAANAMLATRISFINEIANLCEMVGADINYVRKGIGSDPRIGNKFIYPGIGYGGSCFPKDVKALIKTGNDENCNLAVLKAVEEVNARQKLVLIDKILKHYNGNIENRTFAIWGLAFKPHTDDIREAPSIIIIKELIKHKAKIKAYDPVAMPEARHVLGDSVEYCKDSYEALFDADALVIVTEWPEFRVPNYKIFERLIKNKLIFDGRNIFESNEMKELGFTYYCIGKSNF